MKKFIAIIVAVVSLLTLSIPAFAAGVAYFCDEFCIGVVSSGEYCYYYETTVAGYKFKAAALNGHYGIRSDTIAEWHCITPVPQASVLNRTLKEVCEDLDALTSLLHDGCSQRLVDLIIDDIRRLEDELEAYETISIEPTSPENIEVINHPVEPVHPSYPESILFEDTDYNDFSSEVFINPDVAVWDEIYECEFEDDPQFTAN